MSENKKKTSEKIKDVLMILPALIVSIIFFPIAILVLIDLIREQVYISKQISRVKDEGYTVSKVKNDGKKVYLFTAGALAIKFLPNEIFDISFDGGEKYLSIFESNIGTPQEIAHLKYLHDQYKAVDYRDRSEYDSTEAFITFILKNITIDK